MVTIDNLIQSNLNLLSKIYVTKKEQTSITANAFINKTRNDSIQPEIIKERIKWLKKWGTYK